MSNSIRGRAALFLLCGGVTVFTASVASAQWNVAAWGRHHVGQCAVPALPAGRSYVEIAAGELHTLARLDDGSVIAFGGNANGQCNVPTLPAGLTFVAISAGWDQSLAILSDGTAIGWGGNGSGQETPPPPPAGASYVAISAGHVHSLGLFDDGSVVQFGFSAQPVPALPAGMTYTQIADGGAHSLALRSDGNVIGWGFCYFGDCTAPALPAGVTYVEIATGFGHSLALRSDGEVVGFGLNSHGECDVPPLPAGVTYVDIEAGGYHSLALRSDGVLLAWGDNPYGECDAPESGLGTSFLELAAGYYHSLARYDPPTPAPTVYCTAKTNSLGCTPSIASSFAPSASSKSGCTLVTSHVVGKKPGLYFHSTVSGDSQPFHDGYLCTSTVKRHHAVLNSGGTAGTCDGAFFEDFNAYVASGHDPALVAGAKVWLQNWSRDPVATFGDGLSDALELVIGP